MKDKFCNPPIPRNIFLHNNSIGTIIFYIATNFLVRSNVVTREGLNQQKSAHREENVKKERSKKIKGV